MKIRLAQEKDLDVILAWDKHISRQILFESILAGRVYIAEEDGIFCGWLRYNLFWDNTPFMNMLYLLEKHRGKGYGKKLVEHWENEMRNLGYLAVMTSTQSNEYSQHFYMKSGYKTIGGFLLEDDPFEIIMSKEL